MNFRMFSMAVLVSALPLGALAESAISSLNEGDFISVERVSPNGESVVNVKLSKSGKAKLKKFNLVAVQK